MQQLPGYSSNCLDIPPTVRISYQPIGYRPSGFSNIPPTVRILDIPTAFSDSSQTGWKSHQLHEYPQTAWILYHHAGIHL